MSKKDYAQLSGNQTVETSEEEELTSEDVDTGADENNEGNQEEESENDSDVSEESSDDSEESESESDKGEDDKSKPEESSEEDESIEGSLEELLNESEPLQISKKSKYRDLEDGDFVENADGTHIIISGDLSNDIEEILGNPDRDIPQRLERFEHIYRSKPNKAERIAKIFQCHNAEEFIGNLKLLRSARNNEDNDLQNEALSRFPEWLIDENKPVPFSFSITKPASNTRAQSVAKKDMPWSSSELDNAINAYCAEHGKTRKDLLRDPDIGKHLKDFSKMSRDGKPLPAYEVLEMAMRMSGGVKKSSKKNISLGGAKNNARNSSEEKKSSLQKKIDAENKSLMDSGLPPLSEKFVKDVLEGRQTLTT